MFSKRGLVLSLHASLANQGLEVGSNLKPTSQWHDLSGKGNHGILNGFNFTTDDVWVGRNTLTNPYALFLNGTSNYIRCSSTNIAKPIFSFTFEVWIYYIGGNTILSSGGQLNDTQGISVRFNDMGELELQLATSNRKAYTNLGRLPKNEWYHIAGSYDDLTGNLSAFLNGAPQGIVRAEAAEHHKLPSNLFIGRDSADNSKWLRGYIPIIRMYDVALTMDEIAENYLAGYLLNIDHSDIPIRAGLPERNNVTGYLRIGINRKFKAKYTIIPNDMADMSSNIRIKKSIDLDSSMYINPSASVKIRYGITPVDNGDVQGAIKIKVSKNLTALLSVNVSAKATAQYDVNSLKPNDLPANLSIVQQRLPSRMAVYAHSTLAAKYNIHTLQEQDLKAIVEVKQPNDVISVLKINARTKGSGIYHVLGIEHDNLSSSLQIKSIRQLNSILSVRVHTQMAAKYSILSIATGDILSLLTVRSISELHSNIQVGTHSRMIGHYDISLSNVMDMRSCLDIKETGDIPSSFSISPYTKTTGRYQMVAQNRDDLSSVLTVQEVSDLSSTVGISPYTWMKGKYDVIEPPTYTVSVYSNRDAFVRESQPRLNYGVEEQMYVGYSTSALERFRSYVGFDLESASIPKENTTIKSAELKVYFDGRDIPEKAIQLIEASKEWTEYGVTWQNQPYPFGFSSPTSTYNGINVVKDVGGNSDYFYFNVTNSIRDWYEGKRPNFGYILKALDEFENGSIRFFTKEEKSYRPILDITYYDTRIYSLGRNSIAGSITSRLNKITDLAVSFRIKQFYGETIRQGNLFVHNPREIVADIAVSKPNMDCGLAIRRKRKDSIDGQVIVAVGLENSIDGCLLVNKKIVPTHLYILYRDDLAAEISVVKWVKPFPILPGVLYVSRRDITGSMTAIRTGNHDFLSDIVLSIPKIPGSIDVLKGSVKEGSVSVRRYCDGEIMAEGYLPYRCDMPTELRVHNLNLYGSIQVVFISQLMSGLFVRSQEHSEKSSTITLPHHASLESSLSIWPKKDYPSSITVLSGYLSGSITIPYNKLKDILSRITVRVKLVSDMEIAIGIRSGYLGSNIKVRIDSYVDQFSYLQIRCSNHGYFPGELYVSTWEKSEMKSMISARKNRDSDKWSRISVQLSRWNDLVANLSVLVMEPKDLNSDLEIRRKETYDKRGRVIVRHLDQMEIPADLGVREHSHISGILAVRRMERIYIPSNVSIWNKSAINGAVTVRQYSYRDLHTSMDIWKRAILESYISVWQKSFLPGTIQVQVYDNLESSIEVATEYGYSFII
ncbi:DNRLRE domain-containing protein [Paenibacillus sp. FSL M7-0802]|uniref:DNRLRE domain-containing protein n=1 Tax=Paenibacillus TaxID=44249 RepID=UPI0003D34283|nr:DNRLRE domain-containing protein [Paenibacillus polymyxa]AHC19033.1 hypothetical protein X809_07265 [Paenibacillus polymyxa CR1]